MRNPNVKEITVECSSPEELIRKYLSVWEGIVKLTEKEKQVFIAIFLEFTTNKMKDDDATWEYVFSTAVRTRIRKELGISTSYWNVILNSLRNKKVLLGNRIDPRLIPSNLSFNFVIV